MSRNLTGKRAGLGATAADDLGCDLSAARSGIITAIMLGLGAPLARR